MSKFNKNLIHIVWPPFLGLSTFGKLIIFTIRTFFYPYAMPPPPLFNVVLPSSKPDQEISKSDFYQTKFLQKIWKKTDPNLLFWGENRTGSKNLIPTFGKSTFIWKYSVFKNFFKVFLASCGRPNKWKSDFLDFWGQKADFSGKKRTNLGPDQGLVKRTYLAALQRLSTFEDPPPPYPQNVEDLSFFF